MSTTEQWKDIHKIALELLEKVKMTWQEFERHKLQHNIDGTEEALRDGS